MSEMKFPAIAPTQNSNALMQPSVNVFVHPFMLCRLRGDSAVAV